VGRTLFADKREKKFAICYGVKNSLASKRRLPFEFFDILIDLATRSWFWFVTSGLSDLINIH